MTKKDDELENNNNKYKLAKLKRTDWKREFVESTKLKSKCWQQKATFLFYFNRIAMDMMSHIFIKQNA